MGLVIEAGGILRHQEQLPGSRHPAALGGLRDMPLKQTRYRGSRMFEDAVGGLPPTAPQAVEKAAPGCCAKRSQMRVRLVIQRRSQTSAPSISVRAHGSDITGSSSLLFGRRTTKDSRTYESRLGPGCVPCGGCGRRWGGARQRLPCSPSRLPPPRRWSRASGGISPTPPVWPAPARPRARAPGRSATPRCLGTPTAAKPARTGAAGGLLFLRAQDPSADAEELAERLIEGAAREGLVVSRRASFGFNETSLDPWGREILRVSAGTEAAPEARRMARLFRRTLRDSAGRR
jgi:hypothetical protein